MPNTKRKTISPCSSRAESVKFWPLRRQARRDNSDVLGSYTGTPKDGGEPVQDADDL